ncbi:MAG: hypothetical protein ACYDHU_11555, partial [Acidimicrobiales bacterium]
MTPDKQPAAGTGPPPDAPDIPATGEVAGGPDGDGAAPAGLPPDASRRLAELEDRPGHKGMFTSDLSV